MTRVAIAWTRGDAHAVAPTSGTLLHILDDDVEITHEPLRDRKEINTFRRQGNRPGGPVEEA